MHCATKPEFAFQHIQRQFADHIRAPAERLLPQGIATERSAIYRELFFNNMVNFLSESFPVLNEVMAETRWQALVEDFYAHHICETPLFTRLGEEFLDYPQKERKPVVDDPPYLAELAHYEWVELGITLSDANPLPVEVVVADLSQCRIRLSPLAWLLSYHYPVHQIGPGYPVATPDEELFYLLVYRDRQEQVVFLEIDLISHSLLSALQSVGEAQTSELLETLANSNGLAGDPDRNHWGYLVTDRTRRALDFYSANDHYAGRRLYSALAKWLAGHRGRNGVTVR
jgi:hypothetical protein